LKEKGNYSVVFPSNPSGLASASAFVLRTVPSMCARLFFLYIPFFENRNGEFVLPFKSTAKAITLNDDHGDFSPIFSVTSSSIIRIS